MADQYPNRTNRALSFARIQLKQLEQVRQTEGWSQDLEVEALETAVVFHLSVALHAYRREIAERYTLPTEGVETLQDLIDAQTKQGQTTSEVTEFQVLSESTNSWLAQIEQRYLSCWGGTPKAKNRGSASEISLVQIEPGRVEINELSLATLYSELYSLISRQRAAMQEW
ncbi:MAG TPA: DUF6586 family protein [Marinobacterium sp.]|nr:DUF6586 family protein [Marinobacterium sp.]